MQERSFKRAALFGVLGALIFLVVNFTLCELWGGLKNFVPSPLAAFSAFTAS